MRTQHDPDGTRPPIKLDAARVDYSENPDPRFQTDGARTRYEFLRLRRLPGSSPA